MEEVFMNENHTDVLDAANLDYLPNNPLLRTQQDLFDNLDDIDFIVDIHQAEPAKEDGNYHRPQGINQEEDTEHRTESRHDTNTLSTHECSNSIPDNTAVSQVTNDADHITVQQAYPDMNPNLMHKAYQDARQPTKHQVYKELYYELGINTLFKGDGQIGEGDGQEGKEALNQQDESRDMQDTSQIIEEKVYIEADSQLEQDGATQSEPVFLARLKRGRKPGRGTRGSRGGRVGRPPKRKKIEDDEEYIGEEEEEEDEDDDENDDHEEDEGKEKMQKVNKRDNNDYNDKDENSNEVQDGSDKPRIVGVGDTNVRLEYTLYEDWRILVTTDDYIEKNGPKGLQSITLWQQLRDPQTKEKLLYKKRSYESMRDRYKRYIMLLNKEDKEKVRKFAEDHEPEEMKKYHCLFKKVQKKRRFIGISDQLNYDPSRIRRRTKYNVKYKERRQERLKEKAIPKQRGRKRKEIKGSLEETFDKGAADSEDDNTLSNSNNSFNEDSDNFDVGQLTGRRRKRSQKTHRASMCENSMEENPDFQFLKATRGTIAEFSRGAEASKMSEEQSSFIKEEDGANEVAERVDAGDSSNGDVTRRYKRKQNVEIEEPKGIEQEYLAAKRAHRNRSVNEEKPNAKRRKKSRGTTIQILSPNSNPVQSADQASVPHYGYFRSEENSRSEHFSQDQITRELPQYESNYYREPERPNNMVQVWKGSPQTGIFGNKQSPMDYSRYQGMPDTSGSQNIQPLEAIGNLRRHQPIGMINGKYGPMSYIKEEEIPITSEKLKILKSDEELTKNTRKASEVFMTRNSQKPFGLANCPRGNMISEIWILADYEQKFRQFVRDEETPSTEDVSIRRNSDMLSDFASRYHINLNQVSHLFSAVSCNYTDLEHYLEERDASILWNEDDDIILRGGDDRQISILIAIKGWKRVEERMIYLGLR